MMVKNNITTIGGAAKDIMFYTNDMVLINNQKDLLQQKLIAFEYGAKIYSDQVYFTAGGGGANAAVVLAKLGIKTQSILCVGNDMFGQEIINKFKSLGINTKLIQSHKTLKTGVSFVANVGKYNEHVIFVYRGANDAINLSSKIVKKINTDWVYLASPSANISSGFNELFKHCTHHKIQVAWNPGKDHLKLGLKTLAKFMKQTTVFNVNHDEALELLIKVKGQGLKNNVRLLLKDLHQYGQKLTVITDGHRGAYLYDGSKIYFRPASKKKGINTTGAGDCFGASLIAGIIKYKWDLDKALKLAMINSNSVITTIGAQEGLLTQPDLKKYNL